MQDHLIRKPLADRPDFRTVVREVREASGISQKDLAARVGICRISMFRIEHGQQKCNLRNALRIANILGIDLNQVRA